MRRTAIAILLAAAALATAACGSDDDAAQAPTDSATTGSATTAAGACPLLDAAAVGAATGEEAVLNGGGPQFCSFTAGDIDVTVNATEIAIDVDQYVAGTRDVCDGPVTDVDAGDAAFTCVAIAPQGFVVHGRTIVAVQVNGAADDATGLGIAGELLPSVTA
ncbi:MAG: hypothetical protein AB7V42_06100 [Thermoleophilia bacterium]